jgi:hypothetical protein
VQKTAAERLQALEHPAIDVLARFLRAPERATTLSAMLHPSTVLKAAKIVLDRAEKLKIGNPPDDTLIDVTKLSSHSCECCRPNCCRSSSAKASGTRDQNTSYKMASLVFWSILAASLMRKTLTPVRQPVRQRAASKWLSMDPWVAWRAVSRH